MELLGQIHTRDEQRIISQPSGPPVAVPTPDRGWTDTGIAIAVCFWVVRQGWALFSQQQSAEAKVTQLLIATLVKQNEILISAFVKRDP